MQKDTSRKTTAKSLIMFNYHYKTLLYNMILRLNIYDQIPNKTHCFNQNAPNSRKHILKMMLKKKIQAQILNNKWIS